jgi:5-methylcytosine-specific restriction endonuclease McrA
MFQSLLFDDDIEARAQDLARRIALEKVHIEGESRKAAWYAGHPFPEDSAKWAAANRDPASTKWREWYEHNSEWNLHSTARNRAEKLGCKIGRRAPILAMYRRATADELILCYWCKYLTKPGERHIDHIQPLSIGGAHVAGNLCISCIDCNLSKGDDPPEVFRKRIAPKRSFNQAILREYFSRRVSA